MPRTSAHTFPMLRLALAFMVGVIIQHHVPCSFLFIGGTSLLLLTILCTLSYLRTKPSYYYYSNLGKGLVLSLLFVFVGMFFLHAHDLSYLIPQGRFRAEARVLSYGKIENDKVIYTMEVHHVQTSGKSYTTLVHIPTAIEAVALQPGDVIAVHLRLLLPQNYTPDFDYVSYLRSQQIAAISFIKENEQIEVLGTKMTMQDRAQRLQHLLVDRLRTSGLHEDVLGVISALTLGERKLIDPDIKENFAQAGAMHILAVSGLHVGIIYIMLSFLLALILGRHKYLITQNLMIICFIWTYAFLTGLSPSVWRAALMFSCFALGKICSSKNFTLNAMGSASLVLLLYNPYLLFSVSFQLSFTALLGIIIFHPYLVQLITVKNTLIRYLWQLITVSLAAQMTVLPLSLHYFGLFPSYFLITNLWAISLATTIIYSVLLCLLVYPWPHLSSFMAKLINYQGEVLIHGVSITADWPYASLQTASFTWTHIFCYYLALIAISTYIKQTNGNMRT